MQKIKAAVIDNLARLTARILSHPRVAKEFANLLSRALNSDAVKASSWAAVQYRPPGHHWATRPNSVEETRYRIATEETAEYVTRHMASAPNFAHPYHVLNYCMDRLEMEGDILEFGVFSGGSINHIARQTDRKVHGFDSFRGLPEGWGNAPAGEFDRQGRLPEVESNVELHVGLFDETLPHYLTAHPDPVALLHIDCDLYSSASTVLSALEDRIVSGTKIIFDEYFNYPTWQEHEYKAFQEFVHRTGKRYEYIAYTDKGFSVAVHVL